MFDLPDFVDRCRAAADNPDPCSAVRELLTDALRNPAAIAAALPVDRAELTPLYAGPEVTVVKVVWAPRMTFPRHDHLTWACIGVYVGSEQNRLYRLADGTLADAGGFDLHEGDVGVLAAGAIHAVRNPRTDEPSAAIHVYGGDFARLPRSNWIGEPPQRVPADLDHTRTLFERANRP